MSLGKNYSNAIIVSRTANLKDLALTKFLTDNIQFSTIYKYIIFGMIEHYYRTQKSTYEVTILYNFDSMR